jgi:uncharacterized phage-associated protein
MLIPLQKLKAILLYFCEHTSSRFLGKTKLMKLFYFLDFNHVKCFGVPVTYDQYINLEHGPVPSLIKNMIDDAASNIDDSNLGNTIAFEDNGIMCKIKSAEGRELNKIDLGYLSKSEVQVLEDVCSRFGYSNTRTIEEASHKEAPWKKTNYTDKIPYNLAADDIDCKIPKEIIDSAMRTEHEFCL